MRPIISQGPVQSMSSVRSQSSDRRIFQNELAPESRHPCATMIRVRGFWRRRQIGVPRCSSQAKHPRGGPSRDDAHGRGRQYTRPKPSVRLACPSMTRARDQAQHKGGITCRGRKRARNSVVNIVNRASEHHDAAPHAPLTPYLRLSTVVRRTEPNLRRSAQNKNLCTSVFKS